MYRNTILKLVECDVKRLPLGAVEAFLLSQIDGRLMLEEIAQIAGIALPEAIRLASRLQELGAVATGEARPSRRASTRARPLEKKPSKAPGPKSQRPAAATKSARPAARVERRSSRPQMRSERLRAAVPIAPKDDDTCDLDDATVERILAMERRLGDADHYALLEIERTADKKVIKRGYFALASKFHPDRFFGKRLGRARVPLERIFQRITLAHDTLVHKTLRVSYDAGLPPLPPRSVPPKKPQSIVPRKSSRKMKAVTAPPPAPAAPATPLRKRTSRPPAPAPAAPAPRRTPPQMRVVVAPAAAPEKTAPSSDEALRRLYASAKQNELQRRVEVFLRAAEDAMKRNDVVGAANNYRLALQNTEDPAVRRKLEDIDALARTRHYEASVNRARAAEQAKRWPDAATYYGKAHAARPSPQLADRAANAILLSGGDLHRAAELAQQAIVAEPKNAAYRVTLAEVFLAAKLYTRASAEVARALEIAPNDARAKALVQELPNKKKK